MNLLWPKIDKLPPLNSGEVHVIAASLLLSDEQKSSYQSFLSSDEAEKARSFLSCSRQQAYIICRALLRQCLANYLDCSIDELCFEVNAHGKPSLIQQSDMHFNLSHSADVALFAFCRDGALGVDIQPQKNTVSQEALLKRYFLPEEYLSYLDQDKAKRTSYFYQLWTRKEALLKAIGCGIQGIQQYSVLEALPNWVIQDILPVVDVMAAVAYQASVKNIGLYSFVPSQQEF